MKKKVLILSIAALLVLCVVMTACTENTKQNAIATNLSGNVASNGGLAVVYGEYLYFVNGYGGISIDNKFGNVTKGAIARVALKDGLPDGQPQIIVPKNVYGTDVVYGGIYISDNYIYYPTTSLEQNSTGAAKTDKMEILRTKVDGTGTQTVAKFDDHTVVFCVVGKSLTYVRNNALYAIDLTDKKFPVTQVEDEYVLSGYIFSDDYLYYMCYNEGSSSDYLVKAYKLSGGSSPVTILSSEKYTADKTLFVTTLLSHVSTDSQTTLFYTKKDNGINTPYTGVYSYTFDKSNFEFDKAKEVRYTYNETSVANLTYTKFYQAGEYYLGLNDSKIDVFEKTGARLSIPDKDDDTKTMFASLKVGSTMTVKKVETTSDSVYLWYDVSNVLYRIKLFSISGGTYTFVEENTVKIFNGSTDTTYLSYEILGNAIYYFNTSISSNIYYYAIPSDYKAEDTTTKGKLLGIITEADIIAAF